MDAFERFKEACVKYEEAKNDLRTELRDRVLADHEAVEEALAELEAARKGHFNSVKQPPRKHTDDDCIW